MIENNDFGIALTQIHNENRVRPRTRDSSFRETPQNLRGITLCELREFYATRRTWLDTPQWRCDSCHRRSPQQSGGCPHCSCVHGMMQTPNLYEVTDEMIKPMCAEGVSYIEKLSRERHGEPLIPPMTFVSHWWGEEFQKLIGSLERYATSRCRKSRQHRWANMVYILTSIVLPLCAATIVLASRDPHKIRNTVRRDSFLLTGVAHLCLLAVVLATLSVERRSAGGQDPKSWSFWICAFANNQFYVEHALAVEGDVYSSAFALALRAESCQGFLCVLDPKGEVYRRAWCVFELFVVRNVLPQRFGKTLELALGNEDGVISDGGASFKTVSRMNKVMRHVHTESAQASNEEDLTLIQTALRTAGVSNYDLDDILIDTMAEGLRMTTARKWMPLTLFALGPITVCLFSAFIDTFLLRFLTMLRRDVTGQYSSTMVPFRYLSLREPKDIYFAAFLLIQYLFFCCVALYINSRGQGRRYWRVQMYIFIIAMPPLVVIIFTMVVRVIIETDASCSDLTCNILVTWRRIAVLQSYIMSFLGAAFGMCFFLARDQAWFANIRNAVEDVFA